MPFPKFHPLNQRENTVRLFPLSDFSITSSHRPHYNSYHLNSGHSSIHVLIFIGEEWKTDYKPHKQGWRHPWEGHGHGHGELEINISGPSEFEKSVVKKLIRLVWTSLLHRLREGKKPLDKVGSGGTMGASAGSFKREGYEGSSRSRIGFQKDV